MSRESETRRPGESHLALNIIPQCNQRCIFCFEGARENWEALSTEEARGLIDQAAGRVKGIVFMGGEALLRKDLSVLIGHAKSLGLYVALFTNGQLLRSREVLESCAAAGLDTIHISLNFHDEQSFSRITRTTARQWRNFLEALDNIDAYLSAGDSETACTLNFHVLVFKETKDHLEEMISLVKRRMPHWRPSFCFKQLRSFTPPPEWGDSLDYRVPLDELRQILPRLADPALKLYELSFEGFPLCALPGVETRSVDFQRALAHYEILANFELRDSISDIEREPLDPLSDLYRHICRDCTMLSLCPGTQTLNQWPYARRSSDYSPRPFGEDRELLLGRWGFSKEMVRGLQARLPEPTGEPDSGRERAGLKGVQKALDRAILAGIVLGGFAVEHALEESDQSAHQRRVTVTLRLGPEQLVLHLLLRREEEAYFAQSARLGLRYNKRTPLDRPDKLKAAWALLAWAEGHLV